jgi:hypothetical protein
MSIPAHPDREERNPRGEAYRTLPPTPDVVLDPGRPAREGTPMSDIVKGLEGMAPQMQRRTEQANRANELKVAEVQNRIQVATERIALAQQALENKALSEQQKFEMQKLILDGKLELIKAQTELAGAKARGINAEADTFGGGGTSNPWAGAFPQAPADARKGK